MKVQEFFSVLEDDALTKAVQLPQSLSKTMQFFHRGNPKNGSSRAHTNIRILYIEYVQSIIRNMRYELEAEEIKLGLKRV